MSFCNKTAFTINKTQLVIIDYQIKILFFLLLITVISQLSSQLESEQFVRTYVVGANIAITSPFNNFGTKRPTVQQHQKLGQKLSKPSNFNQL